MKSILLKNKLLYLDNEFCNNPINLNYFKNKRNYLNESLNNKKNEISYNNKNNAKKLKLKHIKIKTLNNLTISNFDFVNNKLNKQNNNLNNSKRISLNKKEKIKIVSKDKINKLKFSLINKNNNKTIEDYSYRNDINNNNNYHTLDINKNFDSIDNKNNLNNFINNNKVDKNKRKKKYYLKLDNNKLNLSNYFNFDKDNNNKSYKIKKKFEDDTIDDILYGNKTLNNTDDFNVLSSIIKKLNFNNINIKDKDIFNSDNNNKLYQNYFDIFETKFDNFKKLYK